MAWELTAQDGTAATSLLQSGAVEATQVVVDAWGLVEEEYPGADVGVELDEGEYPGAVGVEMTELDTGAVEELETGVVVADTAVHGVVGLALAQEHKALAEFRTSSAELPQLATTQFAAADWMTDDCELEH